MNLYSDESYFLSLVLSREAIKKYYSYFSLEGIADLTKCHEHGILPMVDLPPLRLKCRYPAPELPGL